MKSVAKMMDRLMTPIYKSLGFLAAGFLLAIAILVLLSVFSRALQIYIPGLNVYAGFCMAAASFCAMAYTFSDQKHIRVSLFLKFANPKARYVLELWCLVAAIVIVALTTYYFGKMAYLSYVLGEKSQDIDATPLWIPQVSLVVGMAMFSLACLHRLTAFLADPDAVTTATNSNN